VVIISKISKADTCHFCSEDSSSALEQHHIVPKRHGGEDTEENLVTVCATCHSKLESLYNRRFYAEIGAGKFQSVIEDHNSNYHKIEVDSPAEISCSDPVEKQFIIQMDTIDHFQLYCSECEKTARIDRIYIKKRRRSSVLCFSVGSAT